MSFTTLSLTGTVQASPGTAIPNAVVTLLCSSQISDGTVDLVPQAIVASCNSSGEFTMSGVPANDDTSTVPQGTYYSVTITKSGQTIDSFDVIIPKASAPSVDLFSLNRLSPTNVPVTSTPFVSSFNARTGAVVPQSGDYAADYVQPIGKTTSGAAAPIPFFNAKDYGATGNGTSDDTAAIQAAINAAQPANGIVVLPAGTYIVSTPLSVTSPIGVIGQGMVATTIKASVAMSEVVSFTPGTAGGFFRDLTVDGNGLSTYAINQSITAETSVPTEYLRVQAYGATSYQFVNDKCEDVTYIDCMVPGNESSPTSTPYAMLVTVPNGAINIFGGQFFGECSLQYQLVTIVGAVIGPIVVSNPNADGNTVLKLDGCYIYDGGPNSINCIDTSDNLTNITASACYFVAQVDRAWVNGNMPVTSLIELDNCVFVWGPGTAGTNYAVQASGGGSINVNGYSLDIGSATFAYFNPISSPTTVLSYCDSGNLQSGSSLQAGANGVKITNTGAIQFLNTGGGDLFSGSGAPPSTLGATGDYYFRTDTPGTSGQRIYVNSSGTWVGIV